MFRQIGAGEIIIIVVVLVFLFGAKKLPELARSIGKSAKELKEGMREGLDDEDEIPPQEAKAETVTEDEAADSG